MKGRYNILILLTSILSAWFIYACFQKYKYPSRENIREKVNYLAGIIKGSVSNNPEIIKLEKVNPEWTLFSLSFTTFALTNIVYLDSAFKAEAVEIIELAIIKAMSDSIYNCYSDNNPFEPEIDSTGSVLYFGHLNLMMCCYRLLSKNQKFNELNDSLSKSLYERYRQSKTLCLPSYRGMIWIPDNTPALASLKLHSQITGSEYHKICDEWVKYAKQNYTDKNTGLLYSTINTKTGENIEEPRGSMIGWSIFFIYRFDMDYANQLYNSYKEKFSSNLLIFRLYKERYKNRETGTGDMDSGPLFLGYSIPANGFAFGNAVAMNDWRNAKRLQRLIKFGSKTIKKNHEIRYKTRFVDLQISPMAEALILYFETMTEWKYEKYSN